MSDTPRTDEEAYPGQWEDEVVSALFVRKLEREADQLAIELKRMGDVYAQAKEIVTEAYREGAADAQEEIEELQLIVVAKISFVKDIVDHSSDARQYLGQPNFPLGLTPCMYVLYVCMS